jgi:hypothetical protein
MRMPNKTSAAAVPKLNPEWIKQAKSEFDEFLHETNFPEPVRNGIRGSTFEYPESLILFVAVLSVKAKVKTYQGMHRLVVQYWEYLTPAPPLAPISETQLRERLKKIRHSPRKPARFISQVFPAAELE